MMIDSDFIFAGMELTDDFSLNIEPNDFCPIISDSEQSFFVTDNLYLEPSPDLPNELKSWYGKSMENWTNFEVLDFIESEPFLSCCLCNSNTEKFNSISGFIFKSLSEEHCKVLANSNEIGELIYNAKRLFLEQHEASLNIFNNEHSNFLNNNVHTEPIKATKRPGRPKSNFGHAKKERKRSEKLWEFIINLLKNSKTCPHIIKWEDIEEGTFKFVQSEKVAQLWGARKANKNMNYEKFSRALRYYYKSNILQAVPGKKLVYKFGPQARGWKVEPPLFYDTQTQLFK